MNWWSHQSLTDGTGEALGLLGSDQQERALEGADGREKLETDTHQPSGLLPPRSGHISLSTVELVKDSFSGCGWEKSKELPRVH